MAGASCRRQRRHTSLPAVLLFLLIGAAQSIASAWRWLCRRSPPSEFRRRFISLVLFTVFFPGILYPYLRTSKKVFGQHFYNVNITFSMWCDSWYPDVVLCVRGYDAEYEWPEMPTQRIPRFAKYFRQHSVGQIVWRLFKGVVIVTGKGVYSCGCHNFWPFLPPSRQPWWCRTVTTFSKS